MRVPARHRYTVIAAVACLTLFAAGEAAAQWVWTPQTGRFLNLDRMPRETPELQVQYARSLMLEGDLRKAYRETLKFDDFYSDSDWADENQYLRGEIRMRQGAYLSAANEFQQVVSRYPDSDRFDDVIEKQYEIGDYYYDRGVARQEGRWRPFRNRPFKRAITVYTMVIDNQPFTNAAAEAQYKVGLCHFARDEYIEAAFEFRRVLEDYSTSPWVRDASYKLANTYVNSALPPQYDQTPSRLAIGAIEDFNRRYPVDEHSAQLAEWNEDMTRRISTQRLEAAQFYERRRQFEAARISYEAVAEQFPGTEAGEAAAAWLQAYANGG
jgi:outer membrane protein assembly factor BamD